MHVLAQALSVVRGVERLVRNVYSLGMFYGWFHGKVVIAVADTTDT